MNRLKERRLELGMTQPELSRRLKEADPRMDTGMISRFENGACLPTENVLKALESALQASREELYGEDDLTVIPGEADEMSDNTRSLQKLIPFGRENAISRSTLARKLCVSDRKLREHIEKARAEGLIIINEQTGKGYYQTDDLIEMQRQYKQDTARALSILRRRKPLRDRLKSAGVKV